MNVTEKLLRLEPFAVGYLTAERDDAGSRIANAMLKYAEYAPIKLRENAVFASWENRNEEYGCRYMFGGGISVRTSVIDAQIGQNPDCADDLREIKEKMCPLDTGSLVYATKSPVQRRRVDMKLGWGGSWGGHANPDWGMVLRLGTKGLRERIDRFRMIHTDRGTFYDALVRTLDALDVIARRFRELALAEAECAEPDRRARLLRIVSALERVPMESPRDFFEACQMFWLCFTFDGIDSPGRFDTVMLPYYELTPEEDRLACLRALWEEFHITRTWNLCVGGSDEFWNDDTNVLTLDVLRVAREAAYNTPNLTLRVHSGTPEEVWRAAAASLATGCGLPAIYNDEVVCPALESLGIPASDSHLYCMNGCNQIDIYGKSHMGLEDGEVSFAKCLELTLTNGVCALSGELLGKQTGDAATFATFDDLMAAYKEQVRFVTEDVLEMSNASQKTYGLYAPNPLRSNLIQGCVEKATDYKCGGPFYGHGQILTEGLADTADSLAAIKHFIYDEKKYTMRQLLDALAADFVGYDDLFGDFSTWHKFGNDLEDVDALCSEVNNWFYAMLRNYHTWRGGIFGGGCSTFNRAANYGSKIGALPNGKKKGAPLLADSIGATPGRDRRGPTALLNSAMKENQLLAVSGNVMQLKFRKELFATENGIASFIALAKAYFRGGGQQLSINVLSREELLDAKVHPENHGNLIVRVGGYSDYFTHLSPDLQDNVIARTEY